MPPGLSCHLDLVRFVAALAVLLAHLALSPFTDNALWWPLGHYGEAAVAVFFVLSGYVIAYVTQVRETDGRRFAIGRLSRLLSVALPALLVTATCDALVVHLQPVFYARPEVGQPGGLWSGYLPSLLFVNEWRIFGLGAVFPGSNSPWWSLSFEATYYLVAGLFLYFPRRWWFLLALLVLALAGRTVIALFPLWLLGFALYSRPPAWPLSSRATTAIFWGALLVVLALPLTEAWWPSSKAWFYMPWGRGPYNRDLVADYLVAAAFGLHLLAARHHLQAEVITSPPWLACAHWLGSLTFPLYLCHYPLLGLAAVLSPFDLSSGSHLALVLLLTLGCAAAVAPWSDRLKDVMRRTLDRVVRAG